MTEQQQAGPGGKTAPAKKGKSLKENVRDALVSSGLEETAPGHFTVPDGWLEGRKNEAAGSSDPSPGALPNDHNRRASASDDRLRLLIERIERLEEEKKGIRDDIKDVYAEAKSTGYDPKIMRMVVRLRKKKPDDLREQAALLETYANALGMDAQMVLL